jgi:hypothetical protein
MQMAKYSCVTCGLMITDKIITFDEKTFHYDCFICELCRQVMGKTEVQYFNTLICHAACVRKKLAAICAQCKLPIHGDRYKHSANEHQVHPNCIDKYKKLNAF